MSAEPFNILLVGCGKMGGAMLQRWEDLRLARDVKVIEPNDPRYLPSHKELPAGFRPDVIVFAVKPQTLPSMTAQYRPFTDAGAVALSIAAGKPVSFFEKELGAQAKIVRAMPNTPAAIGKGISAAYANPNVDALGKERADRLLSAVGETIWMDDEKLFNVITALSGSGPAYLFHVIESMTEGGIKNGLPPAMAEKLARQTVIGSAALAEANPDVSAAQLRENVTSPGGTTAAGLAVLMEPQRESYIKTIAAATKRGEEMGQTVAPANGGSKGPQPPNKG
jgi:pyrroline-5-carboxylate reductase